MKGHVLRLGLALAAGCATPVDAGHSPSGLMRRGRQSFRSGGTALRATLIALLCCAGGCVTPTESPTLGYVRVVGQDGITAVTAAGGTLSVRVESDVGSPVDLVAVDLVAWPEMEVVPALISPVPFSDLGTRFDVVLDESTSASTGRWFAVRVVVAGGDEVRVAGRAQQFGERVWLYRFRPDSAPRVRSFGAAIVEGAADGTVAFSEPMLASALADARVELSGVPCAIFFSGGDTTPALGFVCAGTEGVLRLVLSSDVGAAAGGLLPAQEVHASTEESYHAPVP